MNGQEFDESAAGRVMSTNQPEALTTVQVAEMINAVLHSRVYTERDIRYEIDAGTLHAFVRAARGRRRIRVTPEDVLLWAKRVLRDEQMARLRDRLQAS